jgi:NAD(P)-dependent dehydrogenase (short-subunit alcohol dehydrogenase family)
VAGRLARQTAIVTGAGRGFGRAIALGLAAEGAAVTVTARSKEEIAVTVAQIESAGGRAQAVTGDVTNRADVARVVEETQQRFGPVTVLVNNAGVAWPFGPVWAVDPDEWWAAEAVHVRGALLYMHAVLLGMIERRNGHIITISAYAGQRVAPNLSAYCVAKSAQIRLTEHVAAETKEHGVAAFAIEPGTAITELAEATMASPKAQRWLPAMVERLRGLKGQQDQEAVFARCVEMCAGLASGRYDALSGRFLMPQDDFEKLLREAQAA